MGWESMVFVPAVNADVVDTLALPMSEAPIDALSWFVSPVKVIGVPPDPSPDQPLQIVAFKVIEPAAKAVNATIPLHTISVITQTLVESVQRNCTSSLFAADPAPIEPV
jgi:hypothetical protein